MDSNKEDKTKISNEVEKHIHWPLSTNLSLNPRARLASIDDGQIVSALFSSSGLIAPRRRYSTVLMNNSVPNSIKEKYNGRIVRIRLVFIRIGNSNKKEYSILVKYIFFYFNLGEIDTLNEKYQADVYFEARWIDHVDLNTLGLTSQQQSQLINDSATIRLNESYSNVNWTPELFIENTIAQLGKNDLFLEEST